MRFRKLWYILVADQKERRVSKYAGAAETKKCRADKRSQFVHAILKSPGYTVERPEREARAVLERISRLPQQAEQTFTVCSRDMKNYGVYYMQIDRKVAFP